jgi:hypothetical protein
MTKRHAKPTAMQLAERTYRKVLAIEKRLTNAEAAIDEPSLDSLQRIGWGARKDVNDLRLHIDGHFEALRPILDHCARLLKEKETLQREVEILKAHPWRTADEGLTPQQLERDGKEDNYNSNWHQPEKTGTPLGQLHNFSYDCPKCKGMCRYRRGA